ncbi:probable palmitoyltransferase ZDHHC11 isoform X4 [Ailuropoda melanoleuca]|uniref:probable palmitoyltransferase ZDHHC11 isoform X4 n=1 Tax=Ailuropoda melanoleuca TaxID=9646 RepID=UPI000947D471|nr:probable palmitoyltransferase ZDHHC11 isoform X4 [Ailuropoda melanoleuca]
MDLCSRSWRWVVPEAKGKQAPPPRLSRVNGWSRPLHSFQVVAWAMLFIVAVANFGIFIPFLPRSWKYVAYGVTGGLFSLHFLVHLIAVSIDPAEANVRLKKNYPEPMPTFDRSKHTHVVQKQYCHLCEVTVSSKAKHCSACNKCVSGFDHHCKWLNNCVGSRNYWYFFLSVASAAAVLLCLIVTLLYIFIQFFTDPAELRTHPYYKKVSNKNTWLLFLPLFPVKTKTPVVLGIGVFVMLLDVISLLLLGHLLLFHLYLMAKKLSTYDYMTQGRQQQTPQASAEKEELSFQIRYPQQADNDQSSSEHREMLQPLRKCPSPCSTTAIHPENSLLPTDTDSRPTSSSALGRPRRKVLQSLSRSSSLISTTTAGPESALSLKGSKDQRETRQPVRGEGAEEPALAKGPPQKPSSLEVPAWESDLETFMLLYVLPCGSQNTLSQEDARSRSPQAQAGVPATATSAEEPAEGPAGPVQRPCCLQDSQLPEATTEVATAGATLFSQAENPPAAQGETEVPLCPRGGSRRS